MANVIILQRVVPNYRLPIYERIWHELKWVVAYGQNLSSDGMRLQRGAPFLKGFDFHTTKAGLIKVPTGKIIRELRPDAIIAEGALRLSSTWELIARRKLLGGPKLFFWSIGYNPTRNSEPDGSWDRQWLYPAAFRQSDGCLTYGEDGRAFLQPRLGGKPVFIAHNAIDMEAIARARDITPALPQRGFPELISVSRLTTGKEYVKLIEAFRILLQSLPKAHLTIIGDGPELAAVKAAAGEELARSIHLEGALYDESTIAAHMNRADAFVMTGRIGLAINHALAYRLPVICFRRTKAGPFHGSEIVHLSPEVTGYLVDQYNAPAFAQTLVSLFQRFPDLRAQHRSRIETYLENNLSIDRMFGGFKAIDVHLKSLATPDGQHGR